MSDVCFPSKKVKIRKERRCHGCLRKFEKGTELMKHSGIFEGSMYNSYQCDTCEKVVSIMDTSFYNEDGWPEGWLIEDKNNSKQTPEEYLNELLTKGATHKSKNALQLKT